MYSMNSTMIMVVASHPAEVQPEPHFPSDGVLGQLVTERVGPENGIVLSFLS